MLDDALPPFPGFRPEAFRFLRQLKANNRREWFKPRKETYEDELLWPMRCLVAEVAREASARGVPLTGDPKRTIFRIYRDTRFSKNKDPYKTHVGAYLTRSGARDEDGGLYVHVGADEAFVGGGFWSPAKALLGRWREHMAARPDAFLAVVERLEEAGLTLHRQDPLKRVPRGYEAHAAGPVAEYLKARGLYASRPVTEDELASPAFTAVVLDTAAALRPLLDWGWALVDGGV
ncbi:MAG TPA: DUF2461 domain-containing protein [Rubricoccaceae bacterium]|nr:DUF2461 domain-containing protein [Rubricoccaceae bacterium]